MNQHHIEPMRYEDFVRKVNTLPAHELLTGYTYALCLSLPPEEREQDDKLLSGPPNDPDAPSLPSVRRVIAINDRAKALDMPGDDVRGWLDFFSAESDEDPAAFIEREISEYTAAHKPDLLSMSAVRPEAVPWLIPGALARGELALLGADGGTGKGLVQAGIIAAITTGSPCPFWGEQAVPDKVGRVLIFAGEDEPSRVLCPRLLAAGADLSRVDIMTPDMFFSQRQRALTMADEDFGAYIVECRPSLVVIDPLQSFLPAKVDMARRNEMRAALTPLKAACAEVGAAGLIAMHTNKKQGVSGRQRLADSSDLWDMARVVFMMGRDAQQKGTVYLSNEKNNYAMPLKTALLAIENAEADGIKTAAARFIGTTDKRDADFAEQKQRRAAVLKTDVQDAILDELDSAPTACLRAETLRTRVMQTTGCSAATYNRAKLALKSEKALCGKKLRDKSGIDAWYIFRYGQDYQSSTAVI